MRIFCPILVSAVLIISGISGCGPAGGPPEETLPTDGAANTTDATMDTDAPPGQSEPGQSEPGQSEPGLSEPESEGDAAEPATDSVE